MRGVRDDVTQDRSVQAPFVPVTLAFLLGILMGTSARLPLSGLIVLGTGSACICLWWWRRSRFGAFALLLLWGCLGALRMSVWENHPDARLPEFLSIDPRPVQLHGIVVDDPTEFFEPTDVHPDDAVKAMENPERQVCVLELRHWQATQGPSTALKVSPHHKSDDVGLHWQPIQGRVRATVNAPQELLRYGDEVLVEGQWSSVPAPGNPGQYDWKAALKRKHIHGLLRVRPFDGLIVLRQGQGNPVLDAVLRLRQRWERLIQVHFDTRDAGLLLGLVLGQRAQIDEELKEAFQATGTIHLWVISGFNVGIIALLCEWLLRLLGLHWRLRPIVIAVILAGYCVLTGMQAPVARATLMAWVLLGAMMLDRVVSWLNVLAAACLVLLGIQPAQLFDAGFQLSFGAVLCLILLAPRWKTMFEQKMTWLHPLWLRQYVAISFSATVAIWMGLWPVLAWYFYLISPVSVIANLIVGPLVSLLVIVGSFLLVLSTALEPLIVWTSSILQVLLDLTLFCVRAMHHIPGGCWWVGRPSLSLILGYYMLLGFSMTRIPLGWTKNRLILCWLAGLVVWLWSIVVSHFVESRWLTMDLLDVGHGDCLVIRTPQRHRVLVDTGSEEAGNFRVIPFLRAAGINHLDAAILTHFDEDHIGGAIPLVKVIPIRRLLTNGWKDDRMTVHRLQDVVERRGMIHERLYAGCSLKVGPNIEIEVLYPPVDFYLKKGISSNDGSIVLKVTKGRVSFLLTGDIEERGLAVLCHTPRFLQATVLKVPHHGSRLGFIGGRFFDKVEPEIALLSVGRGRSLPAPETLKALSDRGVRLYSTRTHGAISLRTDGRRLEIQTFKRPE